MTHGWLGADWGNVPAWIGSVVTSISAAVAAITYRRIVAEKIGGQASMVAAWISSQTDEEGVLTRSLRVSNGSDSSVYEMRVFLADPKRPYTIPEVPPKSTITPDVALPAPSPTSAKSAVTAELSIAFMSFSMTAKAQDVHIESAPPIEFRDAVGRRWRRESDGKLHQTSSRVYTVTDYSVRLPVIGRVSVTRDEDRPEGEEPTADPRKRPTPGARA